MLCFLYSAEGRIFFFSLEWKKVLGALKNHTDYSLIQLCGKRNSHFLWSGTFVVVVFFQTEEFSILKFLSSRLDGSRGAGKDMPNSYRLKLAFTAYLKFIQKNIDREVNMFILMDEKSNNQMKMAFIRGHCRNTRST